MSKRKRIYQVDLFRFIASLSVVLYHYLFRGFAADNMTSLSFGTAGEIFKYGYLGVDLFFIISGFVIALSIKHNSLIKFTISRITRLYPAYWLCLLLSFVVILLYGFPFYSVSFQQLLVNATMIQEVFGVEHVDGVYWSLFIELKFYFLIGVFLVIKKKVDFSLDSFIIIWLIMAFIYLFTHHLFIVKLISYFCILDWNSNFLAGMILYQIYKKGVTTKYLVLLLICLGLSLYYANIRLVDYNSHYDTTFSPLVVSGLIFTCFVLMYLVAINRLNFLNSPKWLYLGMMTYPLYLLHQRIGFIIFNHLGAHVNKYALLIGTTLLMMGISYYISKKLEPAMAGKLKRYLESLSDKYKKPILAMMGYPL